MDINQLINIIKIKINNNLSCENIEVLDKTFLHIKQQIHLKCEQMSKTGVKLSKSYAKLTFLGFDKRKM